MSTKTISSNLLRSARSADSRSVSLPVTRDLTLAYAFSLVIAVIVAVAAVAGIVFRTTIYPTDDVLMAFAPVDLFHLGFGVPILLGSMALARRGRLIGLLCWPGALLYVLYSYVTNLIGVPFGPLFLPYLLLVALSAYTLAGLVTSIDVKAARRRIAGPVPVRAAGGFLVILTGLFIVNAVAGIITSLANEEPVGALDLMLWIADLTTTSPLCLAGGILLWQRKPLGYVSGMGLLLAYGMLFIGLLPVLVFPAVYDGSPVDGAGLVTMLACGLICLALLARFVRGATPAQPSAPGSILQGDLR